MMSRYQDDVLKIPEFDVRKALRLLYAVEDAIGISLCPEGERKNYPYISYSYFAFYKGLKSAIRERPAKDLSYLEIGCGIGTKFIITQDWLGLGKITGIEINPVYAKIARCLKPRASIIEEDALTFSGYGEFDIIYTYQPMIQSIYEPFIEKVKKEMKSGATLLEVRNLISLVEWIKE